jgi:hypothetical protein
MAARRRVLRSFQRRTISTRTSRSRLVYLLRETGGYAVLLAPLLLAMRALVVAHFDFSIAEALIVTTKSVPFVATTLVESAGAIIYAAALVLAHHAGKTQRRSRTDNWILTVTLSLILASPAVLSSDAKLAIVQMALLPALFFVGRMGLFSRSLAKLAAIVLGTAYFIAILLPLDMWVPPESINVSGKVETVYVLDESEDSLILFHADPVSVERVPKTSVDERQYCVIGSRRSVGEYLLGFVEVGMPRCP